MNTNRVITHSYYNDDGPLTLEYLLPCDRQSLNLPTTLLNGLSSHDPLTSDDIRHVWNQRVSRLKFPLAKMLAARLSQYAPFSLCLFRDTLLVALKRPGDFAQETKHCNAVLVPFGNDPLPDQIGSFLRSEHGEVFEYLDEFRNITGVIPPYLYGEVGLVDDGPGYQIKGIEPWIGSLVFTILSTGEHILYRADGQFGWCWYNGAKEISSEQMWEYLVKELFGK